MEALEVVASQVPLPSAPLRFAAPPSRKLCFRFARSAV